MPRLLASLLVLTQFSLIAGQLLMRHRQDDWPTPAPLRITAAFAIAAGGGTVAGGAAGLKAGLTASPRCQPRPRNCAPPGCTDGYGTPSTAGYCWHRRAGLASGDRRQLALSAALVAVLCYKSGYEERALQARFPGYGHYRQITPRLLRRPSQNSCGINHR